MIQQVVSIARGRAKELTRRELTVDACLAAGAFGVTLGMLASHAFNENGRDFDALVGVLAALSALPLVGRRLVPLPVFAVTTAATAALYGLRYGFPPVGFAIALYTVAERRDETRARARHAALLAGAATLLAIHVVRGDFPAIELLFGALVWAAAWFGGDRARLRHERMSELEQRALRAEREAERERRLAAAEERTRIARELHDSAGHAVNVILVQAGAARLLHERDPGRSREAIATIEEVARETITEIDRLVRVLRDDDSPAFGEVEPPPGLAALQTLAERHRAAGLDVSVELHGNRRTLASGVDRAAYRILQEAITNAARHGEGSAEVDVDFGESALEVTITNPRRPGSPQRSGGHGIVGMRERAALLGGSLEVGVANGAFRLRARLPYEMDAA